MLGRVQVAIGHWVGLREQFIRSLSLATEAKAESAREIHFPSKCQFVSVIVVYCKSVLYDGAMRQFGVSICICILFVHYVALVFAICKSVLCSLVQ